MHLLAFLHTYLCFLFIAISFIFVTYIHESHREITVISKLNVREDFDSGTEHMLGLFSSSSVKESGMKPVSSLRQTFKSHCQTSE